MSKVNNEKIIADKKADERLQNFVEDVLESVQISGRVYQYNSSQKDKVEGEYFGRDEVAVLKNQSNTAIQGILFQKELVTQSGYNIAAGIKKET